MKTLRVSKHCQLLYHVKLSKPGVVLVLTGDEVITGDVLAETRLPERFLVYDVVNQLKLPTKNTDPYIHRMTGESFVAGDVIAQKSGVFSRLFRAKQAGKVVSIRDGKIVLALGEAIQSVTAPFPGIVSELIHERGAVVATTGSVIEGVLAGCDGAAGELIFPSLELDRRKRVSDGDSLWGRICFCKSLNHPQVLSALVDAGVGGLVLGAISPTVHTKLRSLKVPWLLLGGFGDLELDEGTLAVLDCMKGQLVYLLHAQYDQPPMLLCITSQSGTTPNLFGQQNLRAMEVGARVKLWDEPYQGRVGEVIELSEQPVDNPFGGNYFSAVVRLNDEISVRVPIDNLMKLIE